MSDTLRTLQRPLSALALVVLTACGIAPLQPDLAARAPKLEGFGTNDWRITTAQSEAQRLFSQGLLQAYAFNESEAVRQFKAALAADPRCAMCAWGVAWQLGPNINAPGRGDLTEAQRYVDHAQRHTDTATARERALIQAMAVRYGQPTSTDIKRDGPGPGDVCRSGTSGGTSAGVNPLDAAYAQRLHALVQASPNDPDLLTLWAEAAMIAVSNAWWDVDTGKPLPVIAEMVDRLERALSHASAHTGVNHYLIHAADSPAGAPRAVAAADRLSALAPGSPHLVHMPAHTFAHVGRFEDARRVNAQALEAEDRLDAGVKAQGFSTTKDWRHHNTHFHWFGALMQGRGDEAMGSARKLAMRSARGQSAYAEYFRSLPILTLMRLERWNAVLNAPLPVGDKGMAALYGQHAVGTALARLQRPTEARAALALADAAYAKLAAAHAGNSGDDKALRQLAEAAWMRVRAEVAVLDRQADAAVTHQAQALAASKVADSREPPFTGAGAALALGDIQLSLGRAAEAERTFRADLAARPESGWALRGLVRALGAQGKAAEAATVRQRLNRVWSDADAALRRG